MGLLACSSSDRKSSALENVGKTTAALTPTLVQTSATLASIVTVPFTAAQAAGDLNVVVVGWNDSTES
jgi:hypothetical protein